MDLDMTGPTIAGERRLHDRSRLAVWIARTLGCPGPPAPFESDDSSDEGFEPEARRVARLLEWATDDELEAWEAERVRLVVNAPGGIALPLEASWWIDGAIGGPTTQAVSEFMREEGLLASRAAGQPDSLPALLELLHVLLQHQRASALTGQPDLASRAEARERDLLERFLRPWIPRACAAGREATDSTWWTAVLTLLETLVNRELERLGASESHAGGP